MTRRAGLSLTSIPGRKLIDLFDLPGLGAADRRVIVLRTLFRGLRAPYLLGSPATWKWTTAVSRRGGFSSDVGAVPDPA